MAVRKRVLVSGRVQGVFFRDTCRRRAQQEGVSGSARNLPDGRFEAIFEGDPDAVEALVKWCHDGPPHAAVEAVEVSDERPGGTTGFEVA